MGARARRRDLVRKSNRDIREECRKVLCAQGTRDAQLRDVLKQAAEQTSGEARDRVAIRYQYNPVFADAGRQLRTLGVPPKHAVKQLKEVPIKAPEGLTVTADPEKRRILVTRDEETLASLSADQFRKTYMKIFRLRRKQKTQA